MNEAEKKIRSVIERWRDCFERSDTDGLLSLWHANHTPLTYMPTEMEVPLTQYSEIADYYAATCRALRVREWRIWDVKVDVISENTAFVFAFTDMAFEAVAEGHPPGAHYWQGRSSFTLTREEDEWGIIHYEDSTLMPYLANLLHARQRSPIEQAIEDVRAGRVEDALLKLHKFLEPVPFGELTHANSRPERDPVIAPQY